MKNLPTNVLSLAALLLTSTTVFSHTGHLANEAVHGFLHVEHIMVFAAIGVIAYVVKVLRSK